MVTILTELRLKEGAAHQWDAAMRERLDAAKSQPGWAGGQLLQPEHDSDKRVIVGTWRSRDDWGKWHEDPEFTRTRQELEGLITGPPHHAWHDVVMDGRPDRSSGAPTASRQRNRSRGQSE